MSPTRRAPMDPRFPGWDHPTVDVDELDPRIPRHDAPHRPRPDGVPGPAIVLAIVGVPLLILIVVAILAIAAARSGVAP